MGVKELKIKTGVVKRVHRELAAYGKEEVKQQERIDKLKQNDADDADIRKQFEVLAETQQMIPDCKKRLIAAYGELSQMVKDPAVAATPELEAAQELLKEVVLPE